VIPVPGRKIGETLEIAGPDGEAVKVQVSQADGEPVIAFTPEAAGVYQIPATDTVEAVTLVANVDSRESNVRVVEPGAVRSSLQATEITVVDGDADFATLITEGRQGKEIGTWLLYLGILIFIVQSMLAKRFSDRMIGKEDNLSGSLQMGRVRSARRS
jgi:hypothetical protein